MHVLFNATSDAAARSLNNNEYKQRIENALVNEYGAEHVVSRMHADLKYTSNRLVDLATFLDGVSVLVTNVNVQHCAISLGFYSAAYAVYQRPMSSTTESIKTKASLWRAIGSLLRFVEPITRCIQVTSMLTRYVNIAVQ